MTANFASAEFFTIHIQIRFWQLKNLNDVDWNSASFKSGPDFWFCREVVEKSKDKNFCGNYQSSDNTYFAVILSQIPQNLNFSILFSCRIKTFPQSDFMFLDQFMFTFSDRKHSVKFQELKLSTKNLLPIILQNTVGTCESN